MLNNNNYYHYQSLFFFKPLPYPVRLISGRLSRNGDSLIRSNGSFQGKLRNAPFLMQSRIYLIG